MDARTRRSIAYHEAGHATAALTLWPGSYVVATLGSTTVTGRDQTGPRRIVHLVAGAAAEHLAPGTPRPQPRPGRSLVHSAPMAADDLRKLNEIGVADVEIMRAEETALQILAKKVHLFAEIASHLMASTVWCMPPSLAQVYWEQRALH